MQVAIIGAGSFGTVLADIAAHNECDVRMYARREEMVHSINTLHRNPSITLILSFTRQYSHQIICQRSYRGQILFCYRYPRDRWMLSVRNWHML